jgi:hypothetical protein
VISYTNITLTNLPFPSLSLRIITLLEINTKLLSLRVIWMTSLIKIILSLFTQNIKPPSLMSMESLTCSIWMEILLLDSLPPNTVANSVKSNHNPPLPHQSLISYRFTQDLQKTRILWFNLFNHLAMLEHSSESWLKIRF